MLSDPKRLRTPGGHGYLVSWKHRLRTRSEASAAAVVERLLGDPHNVEALRAGIGRPNATMDELAEWLVTGLASGGLNLLKTRVNPPVFDSPQETDLFDLLPPEEPKRELDSLTFEVVDQSGEGVAVRYQVYAPSGDPAGSLPAGERRFVGELEPSADVEVELSAIVLPLRPEIEDEPAPLGPDGVEPEPPEAAPEDQQDRTSTDPLEPDGPLPAPVGPGGEEPDQLEPAANDRFAAAIFDTGGLCFGTDRETFIPTRLTTDRSKKYQFLTGIDSIRCGLEYARDQPDLRLCVVGHTDTVGSDLSNVELSERRAQTVQLLLANRKEEWAALATQNQTVADWQAFLIWAHQVMGMNCDPGEIDDDLGVRTQGALNRFRSTYNVRYGGNLAVEGPFVEADWAAVFDCYRKNLAEQLGCTVEDLPTPQFTEPAVLGCGEAFPAESKGIDGRASAMNRRVDLVFVGDRDAPSFAATPPGAELYGSECTRLRRNVTASSHAMLRLQLRDESGLAPGPRRCRLVVDDQVLEADTATDGYVEFRVPAVARSAVLCVEAVDGQGKEVEIELGTLPDISDEVGVSARLRNLGYDDAPESVIHFQQRCELEASGCVDDETRDRLALEHGC